MMPEIKIISGTGDLIFTAYMVAIIYYLRRYKKILLENYASNVSLSIYKWLAQLMAIIITISVLTKIKDFSKFSNDIAIINNYRIIVLLGGITFITWLILRTLHIPDTFRGVDSKIQLVQNRAKRNDASDEEIKSQIERIRKFMNQHQPYLNPSLTIKELAQEMEMSERDLSIIINHHMNQHFFDFINEYRIRKSMKLLKDNGPKDLAIKEIMFMVGFSSKNSFNTAFKKISQMTPTQYRNLQEV